MLLAALDGGLCVPADTFFDSLKLTEEDRAAVLDKLDAESARAVSGSRRAHPRFEYRAENVHVVITHPGGSSARCLVSTRNLSTGGIAFLHGGFLYNGTECRIVLFTRNGEAKMLTGRVRNCRHIYQRIHEVGLQFSEPIDPSLFCVESKPHETVDADGDASPTKLNGRGLVIAFDEQTREQMAKTLQDAGLEAEGVASLEEGVALLQSIAASVVVIDLDRCGDTPADAIGTIRGSGFAGIVVALVADSTKSLRSLCIKAGAQEVFPKPVDGQILVRYLATAAARTKPRETQPIYTTLADASDSVRRFIDHAKVVASHLRQALTSNNFVSVLKTVRLIKAAAIVAGFAGIADAALAAEQALLSTASLSNAAYQIEELVDLCRRVAPTPRSSKPASAA